MVTSWSCVGLTRQIRGALELRGHAAILLVLRDRAYIHYGKGDIGVELVPQLYYSNARSPIVCAFILTMTEGRVRSTVTAAAWDPVLKLMDLDR